MLTVLSNFVRCIICGILGKASSQSGEILEYHSFCHSSLNFAIPGWILASTLRFTDSPERQFCMPILHVSSICVCMPVLDKFPYAASLYLYELPAPFCSRSLCFSFLSFFSSLSFSSFASLPFLYLFFHLLPIFISFLFSSSFSLLCFPLSLPSFPFCHQATFAFSFYHLAGLTLPQSGGRKPAAGLHSRAACSSR